MNAAGGCCAAARCLPLPAAAAASSLAACLVFLSSARTSLCAAVARQLLHRIHPSCHWSHHALRCTQVSIIASIGMRRSAAERRGGARGRRSDGDDQADMDEEREQIEEMKEQLEDEEMHEAAPPSPPQPAAAAASPPLPLAAAPATAACSRLVLSKLVLENFKSYGGVVEVGPFHSSFSSVVGPNGSGKSNVIDAAALRLRLPRVSDPTEEAVGAHPQLRQQPQPAVLLRVRPLPPRGHRRLSAASARLRLRADAHSPAAAETRSTTWTAVACPTALCPPCCARTAWTSSSSASSSCRERWRPSR